MKAYLDTSTSLINLDFFDINISSHQLKRLHDKQ